MEVPGEKFPRKFDNRNSGGAARTGSIVYQDVIKATSKLGIERFGRLST